MSRHATHRMHDNSLEAYREERPRLGARAQHILDYFRARPHAVLTDREVQKVLGYRELNNVQPRITELVQLGLLAERGTCRCELTGKRVRQVGVPAKESQLELL